MLSGDFMPSCGRTSPCWRAGDWLTLMTPQALITSTSSQRILRQTHLKLSKTLQKQQQNAIPAKSTIIFRINPHIYNKTTKQQGDIPAATKWRDFGWQQLSVLAAAVEASIRGKVWAQVAVAISAIVRRPAERGQLAVYDSHTQVELFDSADSQPSLKTGNCKTCQRFVSFPDENLHKCHR